MATPTGAKDAPAGWDRTLTLTASSFFGLGYLPVAPGTWGTVGALGVWWLLRHLSVGSFVAAAVLITLFAIWVSHRAERFYGDHDVQHIVIDEVAGLLMTVIGVPWQGPQIVAAFVLFRLLDSVKPWPIRYFDRHVGGGFGVVIDDVVAGLIACGVLHGTRMWLGGWW